MTDQPLADQDDVGLVATYRFMSGFLLQLAERARLDDAALSTRVTRQFEALCVGLRPDLCLEVGAFEGTYSLRMKEAMPDAEVIAFEANPFVHERYRAELTAAGVDYRHQAVADVAGTIEFKVARDYRGTERPAVNQLSSIKANLSTEQYELVSVEAVTLDDQFGDDDRSLVAWIDVEGACEEVLRGAERTLERALAVYIEVESHAIWDGQWLDTDVAVFLMRRGFVLTGRDKLKPGQFNLVFVHHSVAHRPVVRRHAAQVFPVRRPGRRNRPARAAAPAPTPVPTPVPTPAPVSLASRGRSTVRAVAAKVRRATKR